MLLRCAGCGAVFDGEPEGAIGRDELCGELFEDDLPVCPVCAGSCVEECHSCILCGCAHETVGREGGICKSCAEEHFSWQKGLKFLASAREYSDLMLDYRDFKLRIVYGVRVCKSPELVCVALPRPKPADETCDGISAEEALRAYCMRDTSAFALWLADEMFGDIAP